MKSRIIIFDDNNERLNSVNMLINLTDDMECVGTFNHTGYVLENVKSTSPDLILMDIDMPGGDGITGTRKIRQEYPLLPVIIQTIFDDNDKIFESLRAGANGYLLKKTGPERFLECIREALQGGAPMTGSIAVKVLQFFSREKAVKNYNLSEREKEILTNLVKGYSYKMIASECNISYNTVNNHIRSIYDKLYVHSATEAVSLALKEKLI